jgi:hypothetical protein
MAPKSKPKKGKGKASEKKNSDTEASQGPTTAVPKAGGMKAKGKGKALVGDTEAPRTKPTSKAGNRGNKGSEEAKETNSGSITDHESLPGKK